jgi:hypothetical protein
MDSFNILKRNFLKILVFILIITVLCTCDPLNGFDNGWYPEELEVINYAKGTVVPKPQSQSPTRHKFSLLPGNFKFWITGRESDVLDKATKRYFKLTFPDHNIKTRDKGIEQITSLKITVVKDYTAQTLQSNESCKSLLLNKIITILNLILAFTWVIVIIKSYQTCGLQYYYNIIILQYYKKQIIRTIYKKRQDNFFLCIKNYRYNYVHDFQYC